MPLSFSSYIFILFSRFIVCVLIQFIVIYRRAIISLLTYMQKVDLWLLANNLIIGQRFPFEFVIKLVLTWSC